MPLTVRGRSPTGRPERSRAASSSASGHGAAVVVFYTDDADQVMDDGPTTVGRQALQQWWKSRFASMEPGRKIE